MEYVSPILLWFLVALVTAMVFATGFWSATLLYFNVLIAGMLATNWYEPLAKALFKQTGGFGYWWDFVVFWFLFIVTLIILRMLTGYISRVRVRFHKYLETGGALFMGLSVGVLMGILIGFSMQLSPISRAVFPELKTDRYIPGSQWLRMMHAQSNGGALDRYDETAQNFDALDFVTRHEARRRAFEREK